MHPNRHFHCSDQACHEALIDRVGFGMVFLQTPRGPRVAHTPIISDGKGQVRFHLARANALAKHLADQNALILVNHPDTYISARWYSDPDQVSTWNYLALELEGTVKQLDRVGLVALLEAITHRHERRIRHGTPWTMDKLSEPHRKGLLNAIVGFEITVEDWRETAKLSQNKPASVRQEVIDGLDREGQNSIADIMRELPL